MKIQKLSTSVNYQFKSNSPGQLESAPAARLHGGAHPLLPEFNYHAYAWRNGRSHAGSCNVAWQLHPVGPDDGRTRRVRVDLAATPMFMIGGGHLATRMKGCRDLAGHDAGDGEVGGVHAAVGDERLGETATRVL